MLVSSFGCSYETADIEFEYTLSQALQKGNNLAFHLIQSFEPGEVDYQKAHEIGKQLADAVTKGQHEYVVTTHIDKGHIHNHIIFCAVNFVDHHKYNSNKRSYYGIRNMSDKLCRENGLSVVVPGKGSKGKSYAEYQAEKTGTSWKGKLKTAVDALIPQVSSFEELLTRLQAAGYEIKPGKYVSCRAPGQERFTRLKTLGADYTEEAIRERIAGRRTKAAKAPREQRGVSLLIDIENSIKAAQSKGYEQWAKIHNLKQAAKTMNFLTEHKIEQYADLVSRTLEMAAESGQAADALKNAEKRLADILPLDLLLLHEAGKGIARNLRIVMQGFVVLEIHIRLERRFLCLCRRPVGFELVAAVALLDFPRPVLCAALCQFFGFVRPLNAGIVLFNGMYLVVDENTRFLCGAG